MISIEMSLNGIADTPRPEVDKLWRYRSGHTCTGLLSILNPFSCEYRSSCHSAIGIHNPSALVRKFSGNISGVFRSNTPHYYRRSGSIQRLYLRQSELKFLASQVQL